MNTIANIIISAATPALPILFKKATKFFVTWAPKKATFGPNSISAKTDTAIKSNPKSTNCLKFVQNFKHCKF